VSTFVPLRVRSHGSLLFGLASPEALVERALALGYRALALTDRDNLYLAVRFWQTARAAGLRPLLGAEITCGPQSALLLPLDRRGFARVCEVLTQRHLDAAFDLVRALALDPSGLQIVVESPGLAALLLAAGVPVASGWQTGGAPRPGARPGGLWLGVRGLPEERAGLPARLAAARALALPLVATGDVLLMAPDDHDAHRAAVTAAAGELLDRMDAAAFASRAALLAPPGAWEQRIRALCTAAGAPEVARLALLNNAALVERCRLELELGMPIFPSAPLPAGETGPGYLRRLGRAGVARRYARGAAKALRTRATARLEWEIGLIERLGFTDYFLLVADIVEFARARDIPTVGRGSGAGSLVSYVLGITNVDPLRHGLYFERFLHPARRDCPDLDIDLCWKRRDEVIEHVYATYGHDRVAMIATHATLGARSAFRETAKALGVPNARVNLLAKRVPRAMEKPYLERLCGLPESRGVDWREPPLALRARAGRAPRGRAASPLDPLRRGGDHRSSAHLVRAARARRQGHRRHPVRDARDRGDRAGEDGSARQPRALDHRRVRVAGARRGRGGGRRDDSRSGSRDRRASERRRHAQLFPARVAGDAAPAAHAERGHARRDDGGRGAGAPRSSRVRHERGLLPASPRPRAGHVPASAAPAGPWLDA
jgi:DNA polymerase III alpha subunit